MNISVQAKRLAEFYLLLAVCNTVVVAKKPHRDRMNEAGQLENSRAECSVHVSQADDADGSLTTIASEREPSPSIESGSASMSSTTLVIPASTSTPRRPGNLFFFSGSLLPFVSFRAHRI